MLSKKSRADRKTIEKVFKNGKFINSPNLTLRFIRTQEDFQPQISFISPKSSSKKAVVRNLLRRRGYAVLKRHLGLIPPGVMGAFVFGSKSALIFGRKAAENKNGMQLLDFEVQTILKKFK